MPRISVIAKNYSKALFLAAKKGNSLDQVLKELEIFKQNFNTNFAHELKNPVISKDDLIKIINEVTTKFGLGKLVSNFFSSIVKNRRLNLFPEIYEEFNRLVRQEKNILEVEIITAVKCDSAKLEQIKNLVAKKYSGKTIALKEVISAKILGGMQIRAGSEVIDISLKNQLSKLNKELLSAIN